MAESEQITGGAPCWVELVAPDDPAAAWFYAQLFGWEIRPLSNAFERYLVFFNEDRPIGACNQYGPAEATGWCVFLATEDAGRALEAAQQGGGRLLSPAVAVADLGTAALIEDPAGASVGLWQPKAFQGFSNGSRPGDPIWYELESSDWGGTASFYETVFGLQARPRGRVAAGQTQLLAGGRLVAGLCDSKATAERRRARWKPHFAVSDLSAAVERVIRLGGELVGPVSENGRGYRVSIADPRGGCFELATLASGSSRAGRRR